MGAGKSRTIHRIAVEVDAEGNLVVDLDEDLIQKLQDDYEKGILDFNMSDEELYEYINNNRIKTIYGWGLDDDGDINILDDNNQIKNGDLKYHIYEALNTANKIQDAFQESTGYKDLVVAQIRFDSPTGDYDLGNGVRGYQEKALVTTNELIKSGIASYYREYYSSAITIDAGKGARLPREQIEGFKKNGKYDANNDSFMSIITERAGAYNGWFSVSGSYSKTTVAHEMGHAVYVSMRETFGKKMSINTVFKDWHERTYNSPVSGYAQRDYSESFAECFSLYVMGGKSSSKMYTEFKDIMGDLGLSKMYGCAK